VNLLISLDRKREEKFSTMQYNWILGHSVLNFLLAATKGKDTQYKIYDPYLQEYIGLSAVNDIFPSPLCIKTQLPEKFK
jgi:hypothetical protein